MEGLSELADNVMQVMSDETQEISVELNDYEKASFQGKYHKQSYRKAWENLPDFKGIFINLYWLSINMLFVCVFY